MGGRRLILSADQHNFIISNYLKKSRVQICRELGISDTVIRRFYIMNFLYVPQGIKNSFSCNRDKRKFTAEEDTKLKKEYLEKTTHLLGREMGRHDSVVRNRIKRLGLHIPQEIIDRRRRTGAGKSPPNKGRKQHEYMTPEAIERTKATRFKKGQTPLNVKKDYHISPRRNKRGPTYYYIRLGPNKWRELHRWMWEKVNGKIPKGMIVAFKDGNTANCVPENLELITQAENMKRNTIHNLPREIKDVAMARGYLKRTINKILKNNNYEQRTEQHRH